jgi:predicted ATPase
MISPNAKEEGIAQIHQGLAAAQATGARIQRPNGLASLAKAYGETGQIREGLAVLEDALAHSHGTGEAWWSAELCRLKGELLLQHDSAGEQRAEACFRQAMDIASRQQAKSLELRSTTSLSRLLRRQGKLGDARRILVDVYGWFTEGFDTADLKEAKALLDELT